MISMTGFGFHEHRTETLYVSVELKSYNNRYLELNVNLPPFLSPVEPRIRSFLSERVARGKVEVYVRVREIEEQTAVYIDRAQVDAYRRALEQLRVHTGIEEPIRLGHLLSFSDIIQVEKDRDIEQYWSVVSEVLQECYGQFAETRRAEGERTEGDIRGQLERIRENTERISGFAEQLEERIQENLRDRFRQVLNGEYDESRMYAETAVLLAKYSINEEIERIRSHVAHFTSTAEATPPVGKKLDFICQELNREVNTIGSKSMIQEVSDLVVDSKDALENIREQLRNVE